MARAELPELTPSEADDRQRARVRMASMAVALALVVAAAVILTRPHPPARSTAAFCSHIQRSADLSKVLASGNRDQIIAAVHAFDHATLVAPLPIEPQAVVLATYADGLAAALKGSSDARAALRGAMGRQQGQVAAVEAAGRDLDQFVAANCHLTLAPAGSTTVPSIGATVSSAPG